MVELCRAQAIGHQGARAGFGGRYFDVVELLDSASDAHSMASRPGVPPGTLPEVTASCADLPLWTAMLSIVEGVTRYPPHSGLSA